MCACARLLLRELFGCGLVLVLVPTPLNWLIMQRNHPNESPAGETDHPFTPPEFRILRLCTNRRVARLCVGASRSMCSRERPGAGVHRGPEAKGDLTRKPPFATTDPELRLAALHPLFLQCFVPSYKPVWLHKHGLETNSTVSVHFVAAHIEALSHCNFIIGGVFWSSFRAHRSFVMYLRPARPRQLYSPGQCVQSVQYWHA